MTIRVPSLAQPPAAKPLSQVHTFSDLVGTNASVASGFIDVRNLDVLRVSRTATGGAYAFEVEWSRDGVAVDLTQALAVNNNAGAEIAVFLPFARFRVRNTDSLAAFTAHRTNVFGR